jgi:hypothetical protein
VSEVPKPVERAERWRAAGTDLRDADFNSFVALLTLLESLASLDINLISKTYKQH